MSNIRRRFLTSGETPRLGNVADAVFYDSNNDSFVVMRPDEITSVIDGYTPIGVVVIPASHDVYGTGQAGVMSLVEMDWWTPDTGSSVYRGIHWGDIDSSLPNLDKINYIGSNGNLNNGVVQGTDSSACLPSDRFSTVTGLDGKSNYYYNDFGKYAPSPYNADGSRNEAYYTTAYSTENAFSDFDGAGNTKVLTDLSTSQPDWKTGTDIDIWNSDYPPACCCWRFHTAGTSQGQWYFPSCGEMGYVINRFNAINDTINKIKSVYPSVVAVEMSTDGVYTSSSEHGTGVRTFEPGDGLVGVASAASAFLLVRAFLRV